MAALNFPSRVRFTDTEGRLTPEAVRLLSTLISESGGTLGSVADVFADITATVSDGQFMAGESISQPIDPGFMSEMVFATETTGAPIQAVTPGASPYAYTATQDGALSVQGGTVSLVAFARAGASLTLGLTNGLVQMATGDKVTITYTVAPTINFIPR